MAVVLASESDGVVIAFKQGRAAVNADRESVKLLRSSQTPILGIVTTQPKAIRAFNARERSFAIPEARVRNADDATRVARGVRVG
jgi:Mrp family chromosome partitioning ATPase